MNYEDWYAFITSVGLIILKSFEKVCSAVYHLIISYDR
jgi:hypothetical protein